MTFEAYEIPVAQDMLRDLTWQKAPGRHRVTAALQLPDDSRLAQVALLDMIARAKAGVEGFLLEKEGNVLSVHQDRIEITGEGYLQCLVNLIGVDFAGADAYRAKATGRG